MSQTSLPPLRALATDYDGTLAHNGTVTATTLQALHRFKESGNRLIMVSGREFNDLLATFPEIGIFDLAVLENGAVLYDPATGATEALVPPPPSDFIARLAGQGLPLQIGKAIVATWEPHETVVLHTIKEMGLELQVIFNKGAVMVLPSGVNKATGLQAALLKMGLDPAEVVGIGDAENDHAFLDICGYSVAVSNALPAIMEKVDLVTTNDHGAGVEELIDILLKTPQPAP
ncbi:MAG: haloacid dehalogenase [Chthoniobacter sp. 12-60-6]|nr:MAG: haloacid dehalogenase [Chthoniobacter sp. 12-60-6]